MSYKAIIKIFDERRVKLTNLLTNDTMNLKPDRVNQIKGAIDEIELFLQTLKNHQNKKIQSNVFYRPHSNLERQTVWTRFGNAFKSNNIVSNSTISVKSASDSSNFKLNENYKNPSPF